MDTYGIERTDTGNPALFRGGTYLGLLPGTTDAERIAILRGLNGPSQATAKRVAQLRQLASKWRDLGEEAHGISQGYCYLTADNLEYEADYLEATR